jgi:hypothetical protein
MKIKEDELTCPCCKQSRRFFEYQTFAYQLNREAPSKTYIASKGAILGNVFWIEAKKKQVDWACDNCLQAGSALRGLVTKQLFCDFPPHFAYYDKVKACKACSTEFVFTKSEQQYWYEQLGFWVQTERIYCDCFRDIKKVRDRISQLLTQPDYQNIDLIREVVSLYVELKEYSKAKHLLTLGKKNQTKESTQYQLLDQCLQDIKRIEKPNA